MSNVIQAGLKFPVFLYQPSSAEYVWPTPAQHMLQTSKKVSFDIITSKNVSFENLPNLKTQKFHKKRYLQLDPNKQLIKLIFCSYITKHKSVLYYLYKSGTRNSSLGKCLPCKHEDPSCNPHKKTCIMAHPSQAQHEMHVGTCAKHKWILLRAH